MNGAPIIHVAAYYPPHIGGLETVVRTIAERLAIDTDVQVLTTDRGSAGAPRRERAGRLLVRRYRALEVAHTPLAPGLLIGLLCKRRAAVVHTHIGHAAVPETAWLACALRGWPLISHFHLDVDSSGPAGRVLPLYKRLVVGPLLRASRWVVVLSAEMAAFVEERYRVHGDRIMVVSNGVAPEFYDLGAGHAERRDIDVPDAASTNADGGDTDGGDRVDRDVAAPDRVDRNPAGPDLRDYDPADGGETREAGVNRADVKELAVTTAARRPAKTRLLFVGRLNCQKNVPRLLRAVAQVEVPVELVVVGDGEDRPAIESLVRRLRLDNVCLVGARTGAELLAWYRWADVFVVSSDKEGGLPLVILEAMAAGLPVVATDVPGISGTLGETGLLVRPDDADLARAISLLAAEPELRAELAARSRERAVGFSWDSSLAQIRDLYRRVSA